jgi:RNA polymerase sigma-70 factor (ECF subfamily)
VRRFVRRLIGKSDAEDDIVQDVSIALFYHIHRVLPAERLRPYVFRIARNCCYDELRKQGRFDSDSLDDDHAEHLHALMDTVHSSAHPEDAAHWLLLHMEVMAAMDRLPELQRQALLLYAEEGFSYADIAVVMNTSLGTVKSRVFYAKRLLRQLLHPGIVQALEEEFQEGSIDAQP